MAQEQVIAINDAVHKIQLAMLDGLTEQKQLSAAQTLMSRSDYEDVVTERTIAKFCGYPLCKISLPSEVSKRGKYRISLKEHKVYDLKETRKFCSVDCLINSRSFSGSLEETRTSDFDVVKLNEVMSLFDDSRNVKEDLVDFSKLTIRENFDVREGDVSVEKWMGPSNAVEGYIPFNKTNSKSSKSDSKTTQKDQKKSTDQFFSEMDFSSTIIFPDEYSVSKLPPTKEPSPIKESEDGEGKTVAREQTPVPPTKKISNFRRERERIRNNIGFDEVPKQPDGHLKEDLKTLDEKSSLTGLSSASESKDLKLPTQTKQTYHSGESVDGKGKSVMADSGQTKAIPRRKISFCKDNETEKDITNVGSDNMWFEAPTIMSDGYGVEYSVSKYPSPSLVTDEEILSGESHNAYKTQDACSSSETVAKSCLKRSGSKKLSRSVTWADKDNDRVDLSEVKDNDIEAGLNQASIDLEDVNSVSRLALAEACAKALSQAAEAVSSGDLDASDAAAKAGIVLLPSTHQLDEEISEEDSDDEEEKEEPTLLKWPNKPGVPESDMFDRDQSWVDGPPEGFNLTLSSFAVMWNALFGWVSSFSLAYIYGKDEAAHEEFLSVNGKEYPRKIIMGGYLSSEIKETIARCLARALPNVATDLRIPIAISQLEKELGRLLETMSLTGAVPSFRMEEWLVIILLFLDALSVSRIPRIAPYISNRNKVLEGSGIGSEEYETMIDILLPLGRVPVSATRNGA